MLYSHVNTISLHLWPGDVNLQNNYCIYFKSVRHLCLVSRKHMKRDVFSSEKSHNFCSVWSRWEEGENLFHTCLHLWNCVYIEKMNCWHGNDITCGQIIWSWSYFGFACILFFSYLAILLIMTDIEAVLASDRYTQQHELTFCASKQVAFSDSCFLK
jgi:hypothetical protein